MKTAAMKTTATKTAAMKTSPVLLSFDLGIVGDYDQLFAWLDKHEAKECGNNLAIFDYSYRHDLLKEIRQDLRKTMKVTPKTRIYIMYKTGDAFKGNFIIGSRRSAPWTGMANIATAEDTL